jgi:hypothetical protein
VGSEKNEEKDLKDFSPCQVTVMAKGDRKVLAKIRFNEPIIYFKIEGSILIVSAGGGLYVFSLENFKKIESLQCNSMFQTYMSENQNQVDIFRIIYQHPNEDGVLNIFSCKLIILSTLVLVNHFTSIDEHMERGTSIMKHRNSVLSMSSSAD